MYWNICKKIKKFKKTKISLLLFFFFKKGVYSKSGHEYKKTFKEEESIEILKIII